MQVVFPVFRRGINVKPLVPHSKRKTDGLLQALIPNSLEMIQNYFRSTN